MARIIKSKVKFSNVDVLEFMGQVVEKHTRHYREDFEYDKAILHRAVDSQERQCRRFVWLCRTCGTWLLSERDVFLKDTREYSTFTFYMEQTREPIHAFLVEVVGGTQDSVMGNVYALDYAEYYTHVRSVSLDAETVTLEYEHGCRTLMAYERFSGYPDAEYGKLVSAKYHPHSEEALTALLQRERQEGVCYREECANAYISRLL
ncbi:MAG: hypothetical protein NC548_60655 [Lachnospiraceae bacterium]|nr:hypothetical protein [Lachnospiraceae bacterium]